jgi:hypothetical protein
LTFYENSSKGNPVHSSYAAEQTDSVDEDDPGSLVAEMIPGWFSQRECRKLYALTMVTNGDILEIGHMLGRSTACVAQALRDSRKLRLFKSYDLDFSSDEQFKEFFKEVHKKEIASDQLLQQYVFSRGSTSTREAARHLVAHELNRYVNLISGNFIELDSEQYDLIFCDAVHEPNEIRLNVPHIIERSRKNCVWAFHDMNPENVDVVVSLSGSLLVEQVDSLGIFLYR